MADLDDRALETERQVEMPKMRVPVRLLDRLRSLSAETGAPMTHHRRRALEEYLDRHDAERAR